MINSPLAIDLGPLLPHHLSEVIMGILLMIVLYLVIRELLKARPRPVPRAARDSGKSPKRRPSRSGQGGRLRRPGGRRQPGSFPASIAQTQDGRSRRRRPVSTPASRIRSSA